MVATVRRKFKRLSWLMNEKLRRRWAACEAMALGRGGVTAVAQATGLSRTTIHRGIAEIKEQMPQVMEAMEEGRIRRPGAGGGPKRTRPCCGIWRRFWSR